MLLAVAHVIVDQPLTVNDSHWAIKGVIFTGVAAAATVLLALVTYTLVRKTADLSFATKDMAEKTSALAVQAAQQVKESAESMVQAQRHHEQSLMPVVWLLLSAEIVDVLPPPGEDGMRKGISISGTINNAGPGPATAIYLHFKSSAYTPQHAIYLGLIGANASTEFIQVVELPGSTQMLRFSPYDCVTRYESIFGTWGAIVQHSASGKSAHQVVTKYFPPGPSSKEAIDAFLVANGITTQIIQ